MGTAAAYAARHNLPPAKLAANPAALEAIQQQLLEDDAFLIGHVNDDPRNLAKHAKITASSEQLDGVARNAIVGPTRSVHGPNGVPRERTIAGTHRWMSDPAAGLPAWIQLEWPTTDLAFAPAIDLRHRPAPRTHIQLGRCVYAANALGPAAARNGPQLRGRVTSPSVLAPCE